MFNKKKQGKVVATVECRMGSSRLPGKVLMPACGKPVLELLVERISRVQRLDDIVIATTTKENDMPVVELAKKLEVRCFSGSEDDVLSRVLGAARSIRADYIVEITGDCPLLDPEITSQVLDLFLFNECDSASNSDPPSFPIWMDTAVFSTELLALADKEGKTSEDREHVSWFFRTRPERFHKLHLPAPPSLHWPDLALTLDEEKDYELIRTIFEHFYPENPLFSCHDIISFLRENPKLLEINIDVERKEPEAVRRAMVEKMKK